jgi:CHASE3 domain sensor protein
MDSKLQEQLDEQEVKIAQILASVKKTEKYMRWTFWTTIIVVVLPLLLLLLAIPTMIHTFTSTLNGLL